MMIKKTTNYLIICAALAAASTIFTSAEAATFEFRNGDRISGELLESKEGVFLVETDLLGVVEIARERVMNVEEIDAEYSAMSEASAANAVSEENPADYAAVIRIGSRFDWVTFPTWEKRLDFGWTSQTGRKDLSDLQLRFRMERNAERNQYRFRGAYLLSETESVKTSDRMDLDYRWRHDLSPGYFYQSLSKYGYDQVKRIDQNLEQKLGLGARIVNTDLMTLSAGGGATGRWREYESDPMEISYLVDVFQDWEYQIAENLNLKQDFRVAMPLEENEDYEYSFSATLTTKITEAIDISLRYELGFDNSLDIEDRRDRRIVSSLGYRF